MKNKFASDRIEEGTCFTYAVYRDDGVMCVDLKFNTTNIEKGDKYPRGLTCVQVLDMITDLTNVLRAMTALT